MGACAASANNNDYYFTRIDSRTSGLAQNGVHVLFQDRQGYIWIGTEGGLNRFDGYTLQPHRHDPARADSLPAGLITTVTDAGDGQLWVGTQTGLLLRYDPARQRVLQSLKNHAQDMVGALFLDADGKLWIGDISGVSVLPSTDGTLQPIYHVERHDRGFFATSITGFSQCPDGTLYAGGSDGLVAIDPTLATPAKLLGQTGALNGVLCDRNNEVFVVTNRQLLQVDRDDGRTHPLWSVPADETAQAVRVADDRDGKLWVAVSGLGLLRLDKDGKNPNLLQPHHDQRDSLPSPHLTRLLTDRSGLVWVGTEASGAAHIPARGSAIARLINDNPGLPRAKANNIRAVFQDRQGRYWVGTRGAGLQQFMPQTGRFTDFTAPLRKALNRTPDQDVSVQAIAPAAAGSLWLGTDHGVLLFDPANMHAQRLDLGKAAEVLDRYRKILVDPDGSLWLAGLDSGLVHYRNGTGVIARHDSSNGLPDSYVFALARDQQQHLWVGMLRGLSSYDPLLKVFHHYEEDPQRPDSLAGLRVTDLRTDPDGTLWIATDAGINKVLGVDSEGLHVERFVHTDGLPDSMVYCSLHDDEDNVWISSNLGISRINMKSRTVRTLTPTDGLQGLEFNTGACLRDDQGRLWFGGVAGLNRLNPANMQASEFSPPTVITEVQYGEQPAVHDLTQALRIHQSARVVRFSFAALDFARPEANRFRYRMVGLNRNWVDNGTDNHVAFTNLRPGQYRFEVQGSNHDGVYGPIPATLELEVMPAWWNSRLARIAQLLLALLALGLIVLALRYRQREARRHQRELREYDDRLHLALWGSGDQFWDLDLTTNTLHRVGGDRLTGGEAEQVIDLDDWRNDHVHPDDLPKIERRAMAHYKGLTDRLESEHRVRHASGQWRWVRARGKIVARDANGQPTRMAGTLHSIERRRAKEHQRRIAASVIHSMAEAVSVTDLDFRFVSVNPAFTRIVGYEQSEVQGKDASLLNCSQHSAAMYRQMRHAIRENGRWHGEIWLRRKNGDEFLSWMEITAVISPDGERSHYVQVMSDITDRKRAEQELRYLANYDSLTGLPNRVLLSRRLAILMDLADRAQHKVAVLFIDLDHFKQVNDSMGHTIGDRMLKAAGERLRTHVRQTDIVARLGGDEFAVVMESPRGHDEATQVAQALIAAFGQPLRLDSGQELITSPSIGIALYPDHGRTPSDLLKFADTAMYQAKSEGRNTWALYTATLEARAFHHASMLTALRRALANKELSVVYQPKLDLASWHITGVEALLRWHNKHLGHVPPSSFIPLAEEAGLIPEIGEFVLNQACLTLAQWRRHNVTNISMAVNISAAQLLGNRLHQQLAHALSSNQLPGNMLELELTESLVMTHAGASMRNLHELKALGVVLAVDDFGTGYSSLAYLKRLPIDILKIDKEFVGDITSGPDDKTITATIINMAHTLGLDVIAEGVETFEQLAYLAEKNCDLIQGNWLSVPIPGPECLALICRHDPADKPDFAHTIE